MLGSAGSCCRCSAAAVDSACGRGKRHRRKGFESSHFSPGGGQWACSCCDEVQDFRADLRKKMPGDVATSPSSYTERCLRWRCGCLRQHRQMRAFQSFIAAEVAKLGAADVIVVGLQASARSTSVSATSCPHVTTSRSLNAPFADHRARPLNLQKKLLSSALSCGIN